MPNWNKFIEWFEWFFQVINPMKKLLTVCEYNLLNFVTRLATGVYDLIAFYQSNYGIKLLGKFLRYNINLMPLNVANTPDNNQSFSPNSAAAQIKFLN